MRKNYVRWERPACPYCRHKAIKVIGGGLVDGAEYTELACDQCGSVWGEEHANRGFLFEVRTAIYRSSSV